MIQSHESCRWTTSQQRPRYDIEKFREIQEKIKERRGLFLIADGFVRGRDETPSFLPKFMIILPAKDEKEHRPVGPDPPPQPRLPFLFPAER